LRLIVAGEGPLRGRLEDVAAAAGVSGRVSFAGAVEEQALADLYSGALAVIFPPFDEDYGYVTLEAFLSCKPVVTTTDAGGPLEFVDDGITGLVVEPTAEAIGAAMARLDANRRLAQALGDAGFERARPITWDGVVERLIAHA
jgi:glycosyltransferase involved in cell wall biosynthesis